ncbi:carcinoembryonic antigen-related cell adhesion molecule 4-like [Sceloporus undulatus]|uniref:carcinoembryonic antigen-related cell adhesion molecule 4-like n=1 Tax=Sceloporus undulatus TaxID=8520 RepID=UPI001C4DA3EB|nr:carcinoembryonic antigen-related cell adhesion molecule 4-like [Sceloporus undulatus]
MEPNNSRLGGDVTLIPGGDMTGIASCTWYRGDEMTSVPIMTYKLPPVSTIENNVSYSGREMVGKDCSLHIEHLTLGDSAIYTLRTAGDTKFGEGKINVKIIGIDPEGKKAEGLSVEAIAGITGGALGVVLILGILALCLMTTTVSHAPTAVAPVQSEVATASKRSPQRGKRSSKKPIRRNKNVSKGRGPPVPDLRHPIPQEMLSNFYPQIAPFKARKWAISHKTVIKAT